MSDDICGETTGDGGTCEFTPSYPDGRCGHHTEHETPGNQNQSMLEANPEIATLVAEEIEHGATVAEALAEVEEKMGIYVADSTHDNWMVKGQNNSAPEIFKEYRRGVRRARKSGKRNERKFVKQQAIENDDIGLLWKIHMQKYGDEYADDTQSAEVDSPPFAVPEELIEQWQQQTHIPE